MIEDMRPRHAPVKVAKEEPVPVEHPHKSDFVPPETIAAEEEIHPETTTAAPLVKTRASFFMRIKTLSKKQWIIIAVVAVVLIGGGVAAYLLLHHSPAPVVSHNTKAKAKPAPAKPTTVASTLTGLQVDPSVNQLAVTGVMIENSELARPQSGLDSAGVVFEAVAEGGITRFLALFQDKGSPYVGPIRSVRPYYIQWGMGFDAAIAHVGGSPEALSDMRNWHAKDLDQFANGSFYHRISSRFAPHNVYTSTAELNTLEGNKGFGVPNYTGLARKAESPLKTPNAANIDLTISSSVFNVHYDYDGTLNAYKRSQAGAPHTVIDDKGTVTPLEPKVVVALVMTQGIAADDLHTSYNSLGSGHIYIFQDGAVSEGTWHKADRSNQFTFTGGGGETLALNPGQTWFTIVSANDRVSFKP